MLSERHAASILRVERKVKRKKLLPLYKWRTVTEIVGGPKGTTGPSKGCFKMADYRK
jgi:hypothetical protein